MYMFDSKDSLRWTCQIAASRGKKLEEVSSVAKKKAPNRKAQKKKKGCTSLYLSLWISGFPKLSHLTSSGEIALPEPATLIFRPVDYSQELEFNIFDLAAALMAVKRDMVDKFMVMDGWYINSVDPCTWNMVGCSVEGFVISLEMESMGLSWTLSPSIGNLSQLRTMLLQNNQLTGPIPAVIGKLLELQALDLSGNQFAGDIPSSLGFLTHLSSLRLSRNKLSGQIPVLVANLSGLLFLYVPSDICYSFLDGFWKIIKVKVGLGCFKGCLPNKTLVVVKRLKDPNYTGEVQFQTEVEMIGLALHRNLLRLYGFCMTTDESNNGRVAQVRTLHEEKRLEVLVDRDLKGCFEAVELEKAVELAVQCTQSHPNLRPKMSEVLKVLEGLVGQSGTEESQGRSNMYEAGVCSFSRHSSDFHEESSFIIEAMELSGPR
ncbi:hypothetical protein GH714_003890 [Hevea brasiliensis]|uniref:Leucine-rich repeat-containing N-terminal plant-type domain-containing protein n=1 Tax=Hevea brasiliensis TaxID=3981 RepID=A0A6A6MBJ1_HEVBR|nr:hypothetical protein GH714_003890 [Hevea brasiliensis]